MSDHTILAPTLRDAERLANTLTTRGFNARATKYGDHNVVLAIAPLGVVNRACRDVNFEAGL